MADSVPSTSFTCQRVNKTTFVIIEDDNYGEQPYIYVKVYPAHLIITDTGCNAPRSKEASLISLRKYIETFPHPINGGQSLNPNGAKDYVIICSHCHYDHILGISQFVRTQPAIVASAFDKSFILEDLPKHSLCKYLNVPTPSYKVSHWVRHLESLNLSDTSFRIQFLHVPGHTPDSLAWYDIDEHHLYVGDTFYEQHRSVKVPPLPDDADSIPGLPETQGAVIIPDEGGNWIQYMSSLDVLLSFVRHQNQELRCQHGLSHNPMLRVKVGCGHLTHNADAEQTILEVQGLFERIIAGEVPVEASQEKRGVIYDYWIEGKGSKYSVLAPRHLAEEARKHFHPPKSG
ncbi:hypothetical protein G7Y89_g14252 [Cudoniella acicularis]|uniref:Metallo-beta-lactamase domain-containing protein n=1 Tax=Cudoniella acicularis TaxID=354080 RepID=A0A8H4R3H3_9HELO|nr:hypothetical protein G7Y89_g14252 [Cudoniella acicularis]